MITMHTAMRVMAKAKTKEIDPSQKGAALVEFALVILLYMALFFMMISASIALYDKTVLTMATAAAARAGGKYVSGKMTPSDITTRADDAFATACGSNLKSFSGTAVAPTHVVQILSSPNRVKVTASMDYAGVGYPVPTSITISSSTTMMVEQ